MDAPHAKKLLAAIDEVKKSGFGEVTIVIQNGYVLDIKRMIRERLTTEEKLHAVNDNDGMGRG